MRESMWGIFVVITGIVLITFIYLFQSVTTTDEQNYYLLKETTEAAMEDAVDLVEYGMSGTIRIDREKFLESFVRRWADNASLADSYVIEVYDINEEPPKVSLLVKTKKKAIVTSETVTFDIINKIDAILEAIPPKDETYNIIHDAIKEYNCPDSTSNKKYILKGDRCQITEFIKDATEFIDLNIKYYSCGKPGQYITDEANKYGFGNNKCIKIYDQPAIETLSCPDGYTLSGTNCV